ncbi:UNVERIFIED_ORG: hypothetical protein GGD58_003298 [Rhizobium pisi]
MDNFDAATAAARTDARDQDSKLPPFGSAANAAADEETEEDIPFSDGSTFSDGSGFAQ